MKLSPWGQNTLPYSRGDGDNLRAEYRCACGNNWSCWWSARYAGWTAEDIEQLNQANGQESAA